MKKLKTILSVCLIFVLTLGCKGYGVKAKTMDQEFTVQDINDDLLSGDTFYKLPQMYSNVISVEEVEIAKEKKSDCANAYITDIEGNKYSLDCDVNLKKIEVDNSGTSIRQYLSDDTTNNEGSTIYVLQGTTKTSSGSESQHGVVLRGYLTWIDNAGMNNEFISASGSRSGSYTGYGHYSIVKGTTSLGSDDFNTSFSTTGNSNNHVGLTFKLNVRTATSDSSTVNLVVVNSPFD